MPRLASPPADRLSPPRPGGRPRSFPLAARTPRTAGRPPPCPPTGRPPSRRGAWSRSVPPLPFPVVVLPSPVLLARSGPAPPPSSQGASCPPTPYRRASRPPSPPARPPPSHPAPTATPPRRAPPPPPPPEHQEAWEARKSEHLDWERPGAAPCPGGGTPARSQTRTLRRPPTSSRPTIRASARSGRPAHRLPARRQGRASRRPPDPGSELASSSLRQHPQTARPPSHPLPPRP
jgi:hypothetical protein